MTEKTNMNTELTVDEKENLFCYHMLTSDNTELSDTQINDINSELHDIMMSGCYYTDMQFVELMQMYAERLYNGLE